MNRVERTTCAGCFVLILIHVAASFFPQQRLWGLDLLYYLPALFRWIMVGITILILLPAVNGRFAHALSALFRRVNDSSKSMSKRVRRLVLSLLSFPLFWLFREKIYLLGDGNLRASEVLAGMKISFTEPLDFFIHALVFKITGLNAFTVYALLSCLAGVALVYLLLVMSDRMGERGKGKALIFAVLISMGANQLFFGYVESYTLMYLAMLAFIFSSWFYLQGSCKLWLPVVMFLLTASLHLAGLTLLPSLIYLSLIRTESKSNQSRISPRGAKPLWMTFVVALVGGGLWILWRSSSPSAGLDSVLLFPLGSFEDSLYPVYSWSHVVDFVNHQLLVSPIGVVVWLAVIFSGRKEAPLGSKTTILFLLIIAPQLLFGFLFNPQLGYPRDWDLFAFTSSGYTILGVYLLIQRFREGTPQAVRYVALALVGTALLSTLPWIYVNATQDEAIARFNHILNFDDRRAALGHECLAYNYRRLGEKEKEVEEWGKAVELSGKPRYVKNLAVVYVEMGEYGKAAERLEEVLRLNPDDHLTHNDLGKVYVMLGKNEKARMSFEKAIDLRPDNPRYYENLGLMLLNWGKFDESAKVFTRVLQLRPDLVSNHRYLGLAYANSGHQAQALKHLELYLDYVPQAQDRIQIEGMMEELRKKAERH